jgi:hypothetical protein
LYIRGSFKKQPVKFDYSLFYADCKKYPSRLDYGVKKTDCNYVNHSIIIRSMKHKLHTSLCAVGAILVSLILLPASAGAVTQTGTSACSYFSSTDHNSLSGTQWQGTVKFLNGPNMNVVEQTQFSYYATHTLYETATGLAGDYTGAGVWGQTYDGTNNTFCSQFVEKFPQTNNLYVRITETGTIAPDGLSYTGNGHGQLYDCTNFPCTAIPNASADTITQVTRE